MEAFHEEKCFNMRKKAVLNNKLRKFNDELLLRIIYEK